MNPFTREPPRRTEIERAGGGVAAFLRRAGQPGRSRLVTGWPNKMVASAGTTGPTSTTARVAADVIGRERLKRVNR